MNSIFICLGAVSIGAGIGLFFGYIQELAARRNVRLQAEGKLASGWAVMPGSFRRIAYLLVALAAVQVLCPILFSSTRQWWVSGGLVLGYAWMLLRQLLRRMSTLRA